MAVLLETVLHTLGIEPPPVIDPDDEESILHRPSKLPKSEKVIETEPLAVVPSSHDMPTKNPLRAPELYSHNQPQS